jgi:Protein of unknown function (DUF1552)
MKHPHVTEGVSYDEKALASQKKEAAKRGTSRRRFLAGAAVTIGLPWFESLARVGRASAAPARPVRFVAWHIPNGVYRQNWFPTTDGPDYTLPSTLAPLQPLKSKLLVFSGLQNNDASVVFGSHGLGVSGMLTCVLGTKPDVKVGVSVDQVYAQSLGKATRIPSLQLGITNRMYSDIGNPAIYNGCVSWASATQALQPVVQPGVIFDQIFAGQDTQASAADQAKRQALSTSVLDHAVAEATSLRPKLGHTDRAKLDEYLTSVREVETQLQAGATSRMCSAAGMTKPADMGLDGPTQSKISCDLMVLALQCDATRVLSFMLGNGGSSCFQSFPWLNINSDHHGLAHAQNGTALSAIEKWEVEQLAYFCSKLDAIDEGGSSMLDNSLVFLSSEIANGNAHDQDNKPILLLGSAAGKIQTGRHVKLNKDPQAALFVAMLNGLDVPAMTFGTAGKGPLPGILV